MAQRIEQWRIEKLIPHARNPRTHSDAQVAQIAASIAEFGFNNPILVDTKAGIIAGHGRLLAARKLQLAEVPVIVLDHLSEVQKRAYILADNQLALNAGWDDTLLAAELAALQHEDFDVSLIGFEDEELARLLAAQNATDGLCDEDAAPPVPQTPISKLGDLWLLGRHRLLCGDSTDQQTVSRVLGSVKPTLLVTDQPYGVQYDPEWRKRAGVNNSNRMGKVRNDDRSDWREAWALFPGDVAYVWHGALHASTVSDGLESCGFEIRSQIVWAKPSLVMGRGHYHWQHEPCWYAVRGTGHWNGDRKQSTLWHIENRNQDAETVHSTQKPVECMRRPIANNSSPGQAVYEPFSGSGTTIIACEKEARIALAIELEPAYVDVAVTRWQNFTGKQAVLDGDGRSFEEIKTERVGIAA
ncbi:MAG: site-specific DNA-methyltransferase [Acidobacteriota bacterium]|nr:site-specific DNA-methyltransferase [Acidobacteriota bacterium]